MVYFMFGIFALLLSCCCLIAGFRLEKQGPASRGRDMLVSFVAFVALIAGAVMLGAGLQSHSSHVAPQGFLSPSGLEIRTVCF